MDGAHARLPGVHDEHRLPGRWSLFRPVWICTVVQLLFGEALGRGSAFPLWRGSPRAHLSGILRRASDDRAERVALLPGQPAIGSIVDAWVVAGLHWTMLQSWFPSIALRWNLPGWSLSDEAFFYLCFPFVGTAIWKLSSVKSLLAAGVLLWLASMIAPTAAMFHQWQGSGKLSEDADRYRLDFISYNPAIRIVDFCIGIVLGRIYGRLREGGSALSEHGCWLYISGILLELIIISNYRSIPYLFLHNGLLLPAHAMEVLGLALGGGITARFLSTKILLFLGNASYSICILHLIVSHWMGKAWEGTFHQRPVGLDVMALYIVLMLTLSAVVFKFVEEPANRSLKRYLVNRWNSRLVPTQLP